MWFLPDWAERLTANAEMRGVANMLSRAATGLHFSPEKAAEVRPLVQTLFTQPAVERFISLVRVLTLLAQDQDATPLSATAPQLAPAAADRGRGAVRGAGGLRACELAEIGPGDHAAAAERGRGRGCR